MQTKLNKKVIRDLLKSSGFLQVNKILIRAFDLDTAIVLADLMSREVYWEEKETLFKNGEFYVPVADMIDSTGLSHHRQKKAITKAEKINLISFGVRGIPKKRYFKINYKEIFDHINQNFELPNIKNHINTINNNKNKMTDHGPSVSPSYKEYKEKEEDSNTVKRIVNKFVDICKEDLKVEPIVNGGWYKQVDRAMKVGRLSEKDIYDLFDEWFLQGIPDKHLISLTRALSDNQINTYKVNR